MPTVTALRARPRDRIEVELDGSRWRVLPGSVVARAGLAVGVSLDRRRARELRRELRRAEALARATRTLRAGDVSAAALRERLERGGAPPAAREEALETLARAGYLDDARAAAWRAELLAGRGYGDAAIRGDLEQRRFEAEAIDEALEALTEEAERAPQAAARLGEPRKAARALARRGFSPESIESALRLDVADDT